MFMQIYLNIDNYANSLIVSGIYKYLKLDSDKRLINISSVVV